MGWEELGRALLILGGITVIVGLLLILGGRLNLGRLPGDIHIERDGVSCTFPLVTSLLLSLILTVLINVVLRLLRK